MTVWDFSGKGPEGTAPRSLRCHETVTALAWRPGAAGHLASGGADGTVALWHAARVPRTHDEEKNARVAPRAATPGRMSPTTCTWPCVWDGAAYQLVSCRARPPWEGNGEIPAAPQ